MPILGYSEPELHDCGGNTEREWYISFQFTNPKNFKRKSIQIRLGINYLKTPKERYNYAKSAISLIKQALRAEWNPFEVSLKKFLREVAEVEPQNDIDRDLSAMTFNEAIEYAYVKKQESVSDIRNYRLVRDLAKRSATKIKMDTIPIRDVRKKHIKILLEQIQKDRQQDYQEEYDRMMNKYRHRHPTSKMREPLLKKFTGNNYNKYKDFLHILLSELEEYEAIEFNPSKKISYKPEIKQNVHRHASAAEEKLIKRTLREKNIRLYVFLAIEELAGMRPKEILGLKISDIDYFNGWFNVWATDGRSKTRTARKVAIPNTLLPLLEILNLDNYNSDCYIFSWGLYPGTQRLKRDKVTKAYEKIVKKGLGLDVTLYSFRGLGADKRRDAGIEKATVSKGLGHTILKTTDIYLEREDERQRRVLIELTPQFDE